MSGQSRNQQVSEGFRRGQPKGGGRRDPLTAGFWSLLEKGGDVARQVRDVLKWMVESGVEGIDSAVQTILGDEVGAADKIADAKRGQMGREPQRPDQTLLGEGRPRPGGGHFDWPPRPVAEEDNRTALGSAGGAAGGLDPSATHSEAVKISAETIPRGPSGVPAVETVDSFGKPMVVTPENIQELNDEDLAALYKTLTKQDVDIESKEWQKIRTELYSSFGVMGS